MTKHTPGPWDVQNKGVLGTRSARHEVVQGINVSGEKNLPTIVRMPDLSYRSYANARLIAAAPDLLVAVEVAITATICPCCGRDNSGYPEGCTSDDCPGVTAIAKARGET